MKRRRLASAALGAAICLLLPQVGHGQENQTDDPSQSPEHEELGRQAVELFRTANYLQALELFEQVYEQSPSPELRFNIAMTYERLGRASATVAIAEELLELPELNREIRARAEEMKARLLPLIGVIEVLDPALEVQVGEDACPVPCLRRVDPGTYTVTLVKEERSHVQQVQVPPGETIRLDMPPPGPEIRSEDPDPSQPIDEGFGVTWATWTGVALTAVGAGAFAGFGLRAEALESDFDSMPSLDTADEADQMVLLANVGLAVAAAGLTLIVSDLLVGAL